MKAGALAAMAVFASVAAGSLYAQQEPSITIDGKDVKIRGCVTPVRGYPAQPPPLLVWSRSDIMLVTAMAQGLNSPAAAASRVFYWLEDDEDLAKHVGQLVEIDGDLKDFERGEIEIKSEDGFTEVELDLGGKSEKIRVPSSWLGPSPSDGKKEFEIVGRRVDVDGVKVIGVCRQ